MNDSLTLCGDAPAGNSCLSHYADSDISARYDTAEYLNPHPEHSKNVPIFAMQAGAVQNRQGGESGAAAISLARIVLSRRENVTWLSSARGRGT